MPLVSLLTALFIGICFYAGVQFGLRVILSHKAQLPYDTYLLFSLLCLVGIGYVTAELVAYHVSNVDDYVLAYRWRGYFAKLFLASPMEEQGFLKYVENVISIK